MWTKDQLDAINTSGTNIIVSAGAGSGKTAVLTERVITKVINGTKLNRLLVLTFTNLAATEMKERIRKSLTLKGLKESLDLIDSSYIMTFDAFALLLVKKYHTNLNIDPDISVMDSSIEKEIKSNILDNIFESMYGTDKFNKLVYDFTNKDDSNLKEIITTFSDKLNIKPDKIDYLNNYINTHYNCEYVDNMVNSYLDLINKEKSKIDTNYNYLLECVDDKFLKNYEIKPLIESNDYASIKENLKFKNTAKKNQNCTDDYKIYKDKISKSIKKLEKLTRFENIEELKESYLSTKDYVEVIIDIINKFLSKFTEYKTLYNMYTFTDIALMAIELLKDEKVREEVKNSFDEIMIDEYQDTSDIQDKFISLISNNNIYMVGDIKQSIYRFRHANPYLFREKYDNFSKGIGGVKIDLLKNFRSREEVIDNINLIFKNIMTNEIGDAEYKESHIMNFGNTNYKKNNSDMDILTYSDNDEYTNDEIEAFLVARDIKNKIESKYQVFDKETKSLRDITYSDFAIIMDRGTSFSTYLKIFEYNQIPLVQIENKKFTSGNELAIIKNIFKFIYKTHNNEIDNEYAYLFTSISRSFLFRLPDEDIFDIVTNKTYKETDLYKIVSTYNIDETSITDILDKILVDFNFYLKLSQTTDINDSIIKIDYLKNLVISLSNMGYTILEFINYLDKMLKDELIDYSNVDNNTNSVRILNIHKSKGLEYTICYYTGLYKKKNDADLKEKFIVDSNYNIIVPYVKDGIKDTPLKDLLLDKEKIKDISERIRLFYVALTRAREKIIMLLPENKKKQENIYIDMVPEEEKESFNALSDIIYSIYPQIEKYVKNINLDDIGLTHDYEKIKQYNYDKYLNKIDIKIEKRYNNIEYSIKENNKYSKQTHKLLTKEEKANMNIGTKIHKIFELEDFRKSTNPYIIKFMKHINKDYINIYKEYEFIYNDQEGFIDLILEYSDHIDIIDYKTKYIDDLAYIEQLNAYKEYISSLTQKQVNTYLYSISDDILQEIK